MTAATPPTDDELNMTEGHSMTRQNWTLETAKRQLLQTCNYTDDEYHSLANNVAFLWLCARVNEEGTVSAAQWALRAENYKQSYRVTLRQNIELRQQVAWLITARDGAVNQAKRWAGKVRHRSIVRRITQLSSVKLAVEPKLNDEAVYKHLRFLREQYDNDDSPFCYVFDDPAITRAHECAQAHLRLLHGDYFTKQYADA